MTVLGCKCVHVKEVTKNNYLFLKSLLCWSQKQISVDQSNGLSHVLATKEGLSKKGSLFIFLSLATFSKLAHNHP